jgi:hypothetical protein
MKEEIWKELDDFKGFYVSNLGRIKNDKKILKTGTNPRGYEIAVMWINGKLVGRGLHTLIARAFIPNPENKPQVNHIDGNKMNNMLYNLEWVTESENVLHSIYVLDNHPEKWSGKSVVRIDTKGNVIKYDTLARAAQDIININLTQSTDYRKVETTIWRALSENRISAYGFKWVYTDDYEKCINDVDLNKIKSFKIKKRKLVDCQVIFILNKYIPKHNEFSGRALTRLFDLDHKTVQMITSNKLYKHIDRSKIDNPHIVKPKEQFEEFMQIEFEEQTENIS